MKHLIRAIVLTTALLSPGSCISKDLALIISDKFKLPNEEAVFIVKTVRTETINSSIDEELALAVIAVESRFRHSVISSSGCVGLMQINWRFHGGLKRTDKKTNIRVGVRYLSYLVEKYGLNAGLTAYNLGEAGMLRRKKKSSKYAEKVLTMRNSFS